MKKNLLCCLLLIASTSLFAQVGIGTTTPKAFLNVAANKDVLFGEDLNNTGNTSKLIWYAGKGAFRAGYVDNASWNPTSVGLNSLATGYDANANGDYSTAMGYQSIASGQVAVSIGLSTTASGGASTAMGYQSRASGTGATALGYNTTASGEYSTATGTNTTASGDYSTAMGANGSTHSKIGSFFIGDFSTGYVYENSQPYQMMMRFSGGYMLYSSAPASQNSAVGVQLVPNGNAWSVISDSTRKENFRPIDGASFLQKISQMRLGSWNYKGQDVKQYRHYGPMAQDFFAAFGHDALGTIGEEKSINQADFDGVNLIAIQALIKEIDQLKAQNKTLQTENNSLKEATSSLRSDIEAIKRHLSGEANLTFTPK